MSISHLRLGASLYVPATRPDLLAVASGERYPGLKSVILCTEDSILNRQVEMALANLQECLPLIGCNRPLLFIRPRNSDVLTRLLGIRGIERIDGFVLPKATVDTVTAYARIIPRSFLLMPTLETREVFDPVALAGLRSVLMADGVRERVLALRIGGNDLLNLLAIRRLPQRTLYDTALGSLIASLVTTFRPFGFPLTAPVFDDFGDMDTLNAEVSRDLEHGLIGKTAIHPLQVSLIERHYRVAQQDFDMAWRILDQDAPAVFQVDGVMCEPATHMEWARSVVERAEVYGVEGQETFLDRRLIVS
ncbi:HpcH/HpaI aldolase/citrate lyase family protein [Insolitispirillum peregrinum]|uniref:HpcH/HpaI aldolase/citrate lyase family protein n=1 Tax=Insolitispirillum peregrinum TaxID=80876 RepID=UPI00360DE072